MFGYVRLVCFKCLSLQFGCNFETKSLAEGKKIEPNSANKIQNACLNVILIVYYNIIVQ